MKAIDASTNTAGYAARIKAAGVQTVIRYIGHPGSSMDLTASEVKALRAHGLEIAFVYEAAASWMLGGAGAGRIAAKACVSYLHGIGIPTPQLVYFACDFDAQPGRQMDAVMECLDGAAKILGHDHVGIYGGYGTVKTAIDGKHARLAWQTVAWSGGKWHPNAVLRQVLGDKWGSLGFSYDPDEQLAEYVGQWPYTAPKPVTVDYRPLKVAAVKVADDLKIPHDGVDVTVEAKGEPFDALLIHLAKAPAGKTDYRPLKRAALAVANTLHIKHPGVRATTNALGEPARAMLKAIAGHK